MRQVRGREQEVCHDCLARDPRNPSIREERAAPGSRKRFTDLARDARGPSVVSASSAVQRAAARAQAPVTGPSGHLDTPAPARNPARRMQGDTGCCSTSPIPQTRTFTSCWSPPSGRGRSPGSQPRTSTARMNAAPFSFFNAMSGNPPVLAFGIGGRAPGDVKDTGGNIRRTGQYVDQSVQLRARRADEHHRHRLPQERRRTEGSRPHDRAVEAYRCAPDRRSAGGVRVRTAGDRRCRHRPRRRAWQGGGVLRSGRLRARQRPLLYRHAEARSDRAHAWRRLVRAHHGSFRAAAHPGRRMAGTQGEKPRRRNNSIGGEETSWARSLSPTIR